MFSCHAQTRGDKPAIIETQDADEAQTQKAGHPCRAFIALQVLLFTKGDGDSRALNEKEGYTDPYEGFSDIYRFSLPRFWVYM